MHSGGSFLSRRNEWRGGRRHVSCFWWILWKCTEGRGREVRMMEVVRESEEGEVK